jgi:hypothetical protein
MKKVFAWAGMLACLAFLPFAVATPWPITTITVALLVGGLLSFGAGDD